MLLCFCEFIFVCIYIHIHTVNCQGNISDFYLSYLLFLFINFECTSNLGVISTSDYCSIFILFLFSPIFQFSFNLKFLILFSLLLYFFIYFLALSI